MRFFLLSLKLCRQLVCTKRLGSCTSAQCLPTAPSRHVEQGKQDDVEGSVSGSMVLLLSAAVRELTKAADVGCVHHIVAVLHKWGNVK